MILHNEKYAFFVTFKKNKTYALRWTNQAVVSDKNKFGTPAQAAGRLPGQVVK